LDELQKQHFGELQKQRIDMYSKFIEENGNTSAGVGWHNPKSQEVRFKLIASIINTYHEKFPATLTKPVVLDAGCGFGDFYPYLDGYDYIGMDENSDMIDIARIKYPSAYFICRSIDEQVYEPADWIVFSGVFTAYWDTNKIKETIENAFAVARCGVIFNMLDWVLSESDTAKTSNHFNPIQMLGEIHYNEKLSRNIIYRHDYLYHDFTIGVLKHYGSP
jgi:SAM-dependent methyltransferase